MIMMLIEIIMTLLLLTHAGYDSVVEDDGCGNLDTNAALSDVTPDVLS